MSFSTPRPGCPPCDSTLAPFLHAAGLPFADVLTADDIAQAFNDAGVSFGQGALQTDDPLAFGQVAQARLAGRQHAQPQDASDFLAVTG
jgi:hypothetical protein